MNQPLSIEVSDLAKAQIRVAEEWWRANRPAAPNAIREELERASRLIAVQPGVGARARNLSLAGVRRLLLARIRYHLYYRFATDPDRIEVLAFWHSSRGSAPLLRTLRDPTRHSWLLGMEAFETIASYSPAAALRLRRAAEDAGAALLAPGTALPYEAFFSSVPKTHIEFFETLLPYYRTSDALCVHGGLDPRIRTVDHQPVSALVWGTDDFLDSYNGDETVIYGHWNNAVVDSEGWPRPRLRNRTIGIDTISHGVLTALKLPDGKIFQSRRHAISGIAGGWAASR